MDDPNEMIGMNTDELLEFMRGQEGQDFKTSVETIEGYQAFTLVTSLAGISEKWDDITPEQVQSFVAVCRDSNLLENSVILSMLFIIITKAIAIGSPDPVELARAAIGFLCEDGEDVGELLAASFPDDTQTAP